MSPSYTESFEPPSRNPMSNPSHFAPSSQLTIGSCLSMISTLPTTKSTCDFCSDLGRADGRVNPCFKASSVTSKSLEFKLNLRLERTMMKAFGTMLQQCRPYRVQSPQRRPLQCESAEHPSIQSMIRKLRSLGSTMAGINHALCLTKTLWTTGVLESPENQAECVR